MFNELNLNNDIRALKQQYKALEQHYKGLLLKYNNLEKILKDLQRFVAQEYKINQRLTKTVKYANRDQ